MSASDFQLSWTNVLELGVRGRGWEDAAAHAFDRLPAHAEGMVTEAVWQLSQQSAGMWVDFVSDAPALQARCQLREEPPEHQHFIRYLDLYCRDDQAQWRWAGVSRHGFMPSGQTPLVENLEPMRREWRLYLPLTYKLDQLELGVPAGSLLEPASLDARKPIVVYGTSIVHGCGHLSRPGMCWPSIVARRLDWPLINLGFSGSARMEPDLGAILGELNPQLFVIDPLANMSLQQIEQNARGFLQNLISARPGTPLFFMANRDHADAWLRPDYAENQTAKKRALTEISEEFRAGGASILWSKNTDLIGLDSEGTTDGSHPSDLGAMRYADAVAPELSSLLCLRQPVTTC